MPWVLLRHPSHWSVQEPEEPQHSGKIRNEVEGKKMQEGEKRESKQLIEARKGKINQGGSVEKEHPECQRTMCWA